MEQAIESLMFKLDNEKRESDYLDDQIKTLESSFSSLKASKKFDSPKKNPLSIKATLLEKQIEFEIAQFDQLKNENSEIRKEVDRYRLENSAYKKSLASLKALIQTSSFKAIRLKELSKAKISNVINNQSKISSLRSKSVATKVEYDERVRTLSSVIRQKSQISVEEKNNERLQELLNNLKGCNVFGIQGVLIKKWQEVHLKKKLEIDEYQKYVDRIHAGFEEIRSALGVTKVEEMVTSFIKSEEQSHELYKYLTSLNTDIDTLQENLRESQSKIEKLTAARGNEKKLQDRLATVKNRFESIKEKTEASQAQSLNVQTAFLSGIFSLKLIAKELITFRPSLQEFIDSNEVSYSDLPKYLKELDEVIEMVSTSISPLRLSVNYRPENLPIVLSQIMEQKDLYDDYELQESRMPMVSSNFIEKASKIVNS
jgi:DNA repair exonuclease SbcCD ATPase subunit